MGLWIGVRVRLWGLEFEVSQGSGVGVSARVMAWGFGVEPGDSLQVGPVGRVPLWGFGLGLGSGFRVWAGATARGVFTAWVRVRERTRDKGLGLKGGQGGCSV